MHTLHSVGCFILTSSINELVKAMHVKSSSKALNVSAVTPTILTDVSCSLLLYVLRVGTVESVVGSSVIS